MHLIRQMLAPLRVGPRQGAVSGFGVRIGLTRVGSQTVVADEGQYLSSCINKLVTESLGACNLHAWWTSIQVNVDSVAELHTDRDCEGLSMVLLVGDFLQRRLSVRGALAGQHRHVVGFRW